MLHARGSRKVRPSRRGRPDCSEAILTDPRRPRDLKGCSGRELANRAEERPRPVCLPFQRLRKADQVARISSVELDHATGKKAIVGTDEASLRCLPVVRMSGQVDAEK